MEDHTLLKTSQHAHVSKPKKSANLWKGIALILFAVIVLSQLFDISITPKLTLLKPLFAKNPTRTIALTPGSSSTIDVDSSAITSEVLPAEGVTLPITWDDLGKQMVADGVIDEEKFRALFEKEVNNQEELILSGTVDQPITMNQENSRFLLDMLWAFGLANKNDILEHGEMTDAQYGGAGNFAATGGWSLAKGPAMDHYSMHSYVVLDEKQQALVDKISRGIYRPCCGNSTHFPDCNHGMAMLGLLELMAKNGASEEEMYTVALKVNSYWFPQTYIDLATYFKEQGQEWNQVDPKVALSQQYSSAQGYQQTRQQIKSLPKPQQGGGGCGA